jgi:hypothetical protein
MEWAATGVAAYNTTTQSKGNRDAPTFGEVRIKELVLFHTGKQWKLPRTRVRNLMARGVSRRWAMAVGNTRKGPWRLSRNGTVCAALPDNWFTRSAGVVRLATLCL